MTSRFRCAVSFKISNYAYAAVSRSGIIKQHNYFLALVILKIKLTLGTAVVVLLCQINTI